MSKKLEDIRKKIDALDQVIHDALMERADLIDAVAAEKRKYKLPYVQPAREAQMIRRLLKRHRGPLPASAVVRIWRELVGAVSLLQTGLKISVCVEEDNFITWDLAKSYFGSVVTMQRVSSSVFAVASVRENESSFAVLPWPKDDEDSPWWLHLFNQENYDLKIVCALPYGLTAGQPEDISKKALVVSKTDYMDSNDDNSFLGLDIKRAVSRGRIMDVFKSLGFETLAITTRKSSDHDERSLHLIEVKGFVAQEDKRLAEIAEKFDDSQARCKPMGGYPVPPAFDEANAPRNDKPVLTAPKEKKKA